MISPRSDTLSASDSKRVAKRRVEWPKALLILSLIALIVLLTSAAVKGWPKWPAPGSQTPGTATLSSGKVARQEVRYLVYLPREYTHRQKWPLLLYLHGAGDRGDDVRTLLRSGPPALIEQGRNLPLIVVSPQCKLHESGQSEQLLRFLEYLTEEFRIDRDRIYVGGYSLGGFGCLSLAAAAPDRFAALVPVAGGGDVSTASRAL
jgi:poly(3-hydroxybutyrate) depolymerase